MLILPLDHPEPFAATLGVMLYPGTDEADRRSARAFAARCVAEMIGARPDAAQLLTRADLERIAIDGALPLPDLDDRRWRGTMTGQLFKAAFALWRTDEALASWSNATKIARHVARREGVPGARATIYNKRRGFGSVAHLWAAWAIRDGRLEAQPEVGYDYGADFQSFLAEAELLRCWGQAWRSSRDTAEPLLPAEVWRTPPDWSPPARSPGWPLTGGVPDIGVPAELIAQLDLKPAGRPRRASSTCS